MPSEEKSPVAEHRQAGSRRVVCAVVTVSDTRRLGDDRSGALIAELLEHAGHHVQARAIVPDEPERIVAVVEELLARESLEAVFLTGGTGVAPRDRTPEAIRPLLTCELPGFGELFRWLSYQEIGAAAMLSRALAGLVDRRVVFVLPGSPAAVQLAAERLILPELGHMVGLAQRE